MSADGNWKITLNTPMGPQVVNAAITTSGDSFTGKTEGPFGAQEITGKLAGDTLTWAMDITQPVPLHLDFEARVEGDSMTGLVKLGMFGNASLSGERV